MLLCRGADPPRSHDHRTQPPTRAILRARVFFFRTEGGPEDSLNREANRDRSIEGVGEDAGIIEYPATARIGGGAE